MLTISQPNTHLDLWGFWLVKFGLARIHCFALVIMWLPVQCRICTFEDMGTCRPYICTHHILVALIICCKFKFFLSLPTGWLSQSSKWVWRKSVFQLSTNPFWAQKHLCKDCVFVWCAVANWGKPERAPQWLWQQPAYVCMYLTFSPAFVTPWFLRSVFALKCSVYSIILMCSHAWFTTEQQGWLELLVVHREIIDEDQ